MIAPVEMGETEPPPILVVGNELRRLRLQREPSGTLSLMLDFRRFPGDRWLPIRFGKMTLGAGDWRQVRDAIGRALEAGSNIDDEPNEAGGRRA
jgi:hypothetical protein